MSDETMDAEVVFMEKPTARSEEQGELVKALCKARTKFGTITKDTRGVYGKYAALDQVLEAVVLPLAAVEVDVSFDVESDARGERWVVARLDHSSGQFRTSRVMLLQGEGRGSPMQLLGSSVTYGRRYALQNLLGLAPDSDDDNQSAAAGPRSNRPSPEILDQSAKIATKIIGKMTEAADAEELDAISKAEMTPAVKQTLTATDMKSVVDTYKRLKAGAAQKETTK